MSLKKNSPEVILAVDPSIAATGWVLLQKETKKNVSKFQFFDYGCIETSKTPKVPVTIDDVERCKAISHTLTNIINREGVVILCAEIPLGSQSAMAGKFLGMMKGMIATISVCCDLEEHFVNPFEVKKYFCGRAKSVSKEDVAIGVDYVLNDVTISKILREHPRAYKEAVYDALAVAIASLDIKKGKI